MSTTPRSADEARLEQLRAEAVPAESVGSSQAGYYGHPVLKAPVWTWEIPVYFFVGGLAGASGVLALAANLAGESRLAVAALWVALFGIIASAALLVSDLGRPARFLYMLRVFKWRSPMSVGVWLLSVYGLVVTGSRALWCSRRPRQAPVESTLHCGGCSSWDWPPAR